MKERKKRAEDIQPTAAETAEVRETENKPVFHDKTAEQSLELLSATEHGLSEAEAEKRTARTRSPRAKRKTSFRSSLTSSRTL